MESSQGSFIPQRPTKGKVAAKSYRKVYVLSYVSYLVFITTLLAVAGIFLYQSALKSELANLREELVAQKNFFNQADLDRVRNLSHRIETAEQLVNSHVSVASIFNALESVVAAPVQFLSFSYDRKENISQPKLALTAVADEFNQIIYQERVLRSDAISSRFKVEKVDLATEPVDPERLELGVQQVVNLDLRANLSVSDINFTGFIAIPEVVEEQIESETQLDSETESEGLEVVDEETS